MKKVWLYLLSFMLLILCGCNINNAANNANNEINNQELKFDFEMKEKCSKYNTDKLREELSIPMGWLEIYNVFYSKKYNSCLAYYFWDSTFKWMTFESVWYSTASFYIITDIFSKKDLFKCWYHWTSKPYKHEVLFLDYDNQFYENNDTFNNDCELMANDFISNIE